ncbi:hypothetical protein [Ruegeria sp.]|uniref:hypothetical protein n=1 Tax=Ruegeria sp. TaxID=1879320 RepID=UPI00230EA658|nr:hypothetical protein [Ruegeria sp.]MDA7966135.1 hypothetical protein [Ruegeria sp.]
MKRVFWLEDRVDQISEILMDFHGDPNAEISHAYDLAQSMEFLRTGKPYDLAIVDVMIPAAASLPKELRDLADKHGIHRATEMGGILLAEWLLVNTTCVVRLHTQSIEGELVRYEELRKEYPMQIAYWLKDQVTTEFLRQTLGLIE